MDRIISDASTTLRLIVNNKTAPWYALPARYCDTISKLPGCAACVAMTGWPATWHDASEEVFTVADGPEAAEVDAWSRRVVGYALGRQIDTRLTLAALRAAIHTRHPRAGLIHHSDRGAQYAAQPYRRELAKHGLVGSMGRRGNPYRS